jgi:ABC-type phosphate transport system substrate-binding protein
MKRFTTLMLGTALAAALSLAAQTPSTSAPASPSTPVVKKHKKHAKKNAAATTPASADSTSNAPAKK